MFLIKKFLNTNLLIVKQKHYSWLSSYQFASNTPIWGIDRDGLEVAYKNQQGFWTTAGDNLQHNPNAEEVKMMLKSIHEGNHKSINLNFTFALTTAKPGPASFQFGIGGVGTGLSLVSGQSDIIGIRDNKLINKSGSNKIDEIFNLNIDVFEFGIQKRQKETNYNFGLAPININFSKDNKDVDIKLFEFKLNIPFPPIGLDVELNLSNTNRSINLNENKIHDDSKNKK